MNLRILPSLGRDVKRPVLRDAKASCHIRNASITLYRAGSSINADTATYGLKDAEESNGSDVRLYMLDGIDKLVK